MRLRGFAVGRVILFAALMVLPDRRHRQLGVGFGDAKGVRGASQRDAAQWAAEALLTRNRAGVWNQLVEALFRGPQRRLRAAFLMIPSRCLSRKLARLALLA